MQRSAVMANSRAIAEPRKCRIPSPFMKSLEPIVAGLAFFIGVVCSPMLAKPPQAPTPPAPFASVEATSVRITAITKKDMSPADLKMEDLSLTEDRVPVKIDKITCKKPDPILLGILLDVSGSRHGDALLNSHYLALHNFVDQFLRKDDAFFLADFSDRPFKLGGPTADRASISAAFKQLRLNPPRGSTAMYDAIVASVGEKFSGRKGPRDLIVVGDWEDNSSHVDMERAIEAAQRTSATIYAILDATDDSTYDKRFYKRGHSVAEKFADETGGQYFDVHGEKDFAAALKSIQAEIDGSCRVDYSVPQTTRTKTGLKLHVEVHSGDTLIRYPKVRFNAAE